jgi:predicted 3-demethylubiquinone-9 3-methyltransferase (glyoxalase superfamily)
MSKIVTHLWFENDPTEAVNYYLETFSNAKINHVQHYPEAAEMVSGKKAGEVMTIDFEIEGQQFFALNGGELEGFRFSPATSFLIYCDSQEEIDHYWERLSAVAEAEQCGWCQDKFGITWQVVPRRLHELLADPTRAEKVTTSFLKMKKFNIAALEAAYNGE